jgi:hypothetical protein
MNILIVALGFCALVLGVALLVSILTHAVVIAWGLFKVLVPLLLIGAIVALIWQGIKKF